MAITKISVRGNNFGTFKNADNNRVNNKEEKGKIKEKGKTIYAADLNLSKDNILAKKVQAQKKAMKSLMDAYSIDKGIDDGINERREHIKELEATATKAQAEIHKIDELREDLMKSYDISEDSLEQKQVKVMEKVISYQPLNEEEHEIFKGMDKLTDYQKDSLEYYKMQKEYQRTMNSAKSEKTGENFTINAIQQGRLKTKFMVDASKKAEDILEAADKEAIGLYFEEAKEHIDDKIEENKEKEEEIKEKEEEKEERVNNNSNNTSSTEAAATKTVTEMNDTAKLQSDLEREIKNITKKMLEEDIKGIAVDKQV